MTAPLKSVGGGRTSRKYGVGADLRPRITKSTPRLVGVGHSVTRQRPSQVTGEGDDATPAGRLVGAYVIPLTLFKRGQWNTCFAAGWFHGRESLSTLADVCSSMSLYPCMSRPPRTDTHIVIFGLVLSLSTLYIPL